MTTNKTQTPLFSIITRSWGKSNFKSSIAEYNFPNASGKTSKEAQLKLLRELNLQVCLTSAIVLNEIEKLERE